MKKLFGKFFKLLFSRLCLVGLTILIQVILLITLIFYFSNYYFYVYVIFTAISVAAVLWILMIVLIPLIKLYGYCPLLSFLCSAAYFISSLAETKPAAEPKRN